MKIHLEQLKLAPALSQETAAYTAVVHLDGKPAFYASNHGHGAGDSFYTVKGYDGPDLRDVDRWLAANEPPSGPLEADPANRSVWDCGHACDLELLVARLIDRHQAERQLKRLLKANILRIGDDEQIYKLKMKPSEAGIAAVRQTHADWLIVNGASPEIVDRALNILSGARDVEESIYERLRENRLTLEDARWLRERNHRAAQPRPDLHQHLTGVIAEQEARLERYRAERKADQEQPNDAQAVPQATSE